MVFKVHVSLYDVKDLFANRDKLNRYVIEDTNQLIHPGPPFTNMV